jgi:hypothetical protein
MKLRWAGYVARNGETRDSHKILVGKPVEKVYLENREGYGGNIKVALREDMFREDGRWMELAQDRVQWRALVLAVLNLGVLLPES